MSQPRRSLRLKPTITTTAGMIQMGRAGSKKVESAPSPGRVGQQSRFHMMDVLLNIMTTWMTTILQMILLWKAPPTMQAIASCAFN